MQWLQLSIGTSIAQFVHILSSLAHFLTAVSVAAPPNRVSQSYRSVHFSHKALAKSPSLQSDPCQPSQESSTGSHGCRRQSSRKAWRYMDGSVRSIAQSPSTPCPSCWSSASRHSYRSEWRVLASVSACASFSWRTLQAPRQRHLRCSSWLSRV